MSVIWKFSGLRSRKLPAGVIEQKMFCKASNLRSQLELLCQTF